MAQVYDVGVYEPGVYEEEVVTPPGEVQVTLVFPGPEKGGATSYGAATLLDLIGQSEGA